ncbi:Sec-independent protein translocase protein TatB [Parasphingorhabdus halotolerans]|uniref:Twin-arginine translocase subunit TatB n=1 Tax=Parasphingorhabdus halotolerans TaxID=2725558 RepID=A0A6H2DL18_9SPHN|nr:Sec-independent protein translocase protein TatB [Parasphingorhabdus halotolerans]QJB69044.1 twin-arginine translocase subunit TatB [Parasphingorhabdus halotolerans]
MFDLSFWEIGLIALVAVVVIGPKELPGALATAGKWMGKARGIMANFRSGLDAMVREAELQEMEKKWASENERIMLEHPTVEGTPAGDEPKMEPLDGPPNSPTSDDTPDTPPATDKP